jgi:hypothetical protein
MTVTTRHIRHDWTGWVDWQSNVQRTVKTVCGVRSQPHLCGIPGVTKQERVVRKTNGTTVWGWCDRCVQLVWPFLNPPALNSDIAPQAILDLHSAAQREIVGHVWRRKLADYSYRARSGKPYDKKLSQARYDELQMLESMFPDEIADVR